MTVPISKPASAITSPDASTIDDNGIRDEATYRWIFARHTPRVTRDDLIRYAQQKIAQLTQIPSGWDNGKGVPLDPGLARVALGLLELLISQDDLPTPQFAPRQDGGIDVSWLVAGHELSVSIGQPDISIWALDPEDDDIFPPVDMRYDQANEAVLAQTLTALRNVLIELSIKIEHPLPVR